MEIDKAKLTEQFKQFISGDKTYSRVEEIVRNNAGDGKVWLFGGYLYRNLINLAYGSSCPRSPKDYNFLIEKPNSELKLPFGWSYIKNTFGNPKLFRIWDLTRADFVPLEKIHDLKQRGLEVNIKNFLNGTPLNIHATVYDINEQKLIGNDGIESIEQRIIRPHDPLMFDRALRTWNRTAEQYLNYCASSVNFSYDLR